MIILFSSDARSSNQLSISIKSIKPLTLPDEIHFRSSSIPKRIQIKIWMHEPRFIFDLKSLASSICCRPQKWRFSWHRITLRVGMRPSCSTSHSKYLVDMKMKWKNENVASGAQKLTFTKIFQNDHFFELRRANFVSTFNLDQAYKTTNPPGWDIFQLELYLEMDWNQNLNAWT